MQINDTLGHHSKVTQSHCCLVHERVKSHLANIFKGLLVPVSRVGVCVEVKVHDQRVDLCVVLAGPFKPRARDVRVTYESFSSSLRTIAFSFMTV